MLQEINIYRNRFIVINCICYITVFLMIILLSACNHKSPIDVDTSQIVDNAPTSATDQNLIPSPTLTFPDWYGEFDCIPINSNHEVGLVVAVFDGRTINVQKEDGEIIRVRYLGIATIVEGQPNYNVPKEINSNMVLGKYVTLVEDNVKTDSDGTFLRYVFVGDEFINHKLVRDGYATPSGDCSCLDTFIGALEVAAESDNNWIAAQELVETPISLSPTTALTTEEEISTTPAVEIVSTGNVMITYIFNNGIKGNKEPDEYVEIRNDSEQAIQLQGWTLRDKSDHKFEFLDFIMLPGQICRIYTNEIHLDTCGFSFNISGSAVWNNKKGDCAYLIDGQGNEINQYCYP